MKITLDVKSLIIGFLASALLILGISFKNESSQQGGKYRAVVGEEGVVILDSETGAYIITPNTLGKIQWSKGDFTTAQQNGIDMKMK